MRWQDKCVNELLKRNLFLSIVHLERFKQILQRVKEEPFLQKGYANVCFCCLGSHKKHLKFKRF
ncbi:MAG: hypothetical protein KH020_11660 [Clostridiales bacterium]|nr:hypothetical protein [Clostridiales bacterium]